MPSIAFFSEDTSFSLKQRLKRKSWIKNCVEKESGELGTINYIFCSDDYLLNLNVNYLKHNTLTDIITFDYSEKPVISGDIFISVERVKENAEKFAVTFETELNRVMIHGVLHLCGYKDKKTEDAALMKKKENFYLARLN